MTLDEFINAGEPWPENAVGFKLGHHGRVVWSTAHYPDGCQGHLICVSRIVREGGKTFTQVAYPAYDTIMVWVVKEKTVHP